MLRLTGSHIETDDRLRPIPFPKERANRRAERRPAPGRDAGWLAERAIEDVQANLDALGSLVDSFRFPSSDDDDRPTAA